MCLYFIKKKLYAFCAFDVILYLYYGYFINRTMALGSTQSLVKVSTRNISLGVKPAGA
jgi:hypothetical protein